MNKMEMQTMYPRKATKDGYYLINIIHNVWEKEHRFLMEEYIGRKLTPEETVHHDDFNKLNNKITNLTLFPRNKDHAHWHRQVRQFGMTQPRITEIRLLKEKMQKEHENNYLKQMEIFN